MTIDRVVLLVAGLLVLAFVLLSTFVARPFIWGAAFVGVNMLQSAVTGFCPLALILKRLGMQPGEAFR